MEEPLLFVLRRKILVLCPYFGMVYQLNGGYPANYHFDLNVPCCALRTENGKKAFFANVNYLCVAQDKYSPDIRCCRLNDLYEPEWDTIAEIISERNILLDNNIISYAIIQDIVNYITDNRRFIQVQINKRRN